MTRRLLVTYLSLAVVVLAALEIPLGVVNSRDERRTLTQKVERDAVAVASLSESSLEGDPTANLPAIRRLARDYARETGGRVIVVDRAGTALVDSSPTAPGDTNFASRPEIEAALAGDVATGTRHSATLGSSFLYVAVPVASGGRILGAVRITYPSSKVDARVRRYWFVLALIAVVVLAVAAMLGAGFARWVRRPLRDLEGAAAAVSAGDLTARATVPDAPEELATLARSFNEMVVKLETLVTSQQEFVADASHELRTPLTALQLRLENLAANVDEPGRPGLEAALGEVQRLGTLVESLLALARADAGTAPLTAAPVDLAEVAATRVETWRASASDRGIELRLLAAGPSPALTSADRLSQILDNLIRNALDASAPGSAVTVAVDSTVPQIVVGDRGPGLTDAQKQRAFDRFWRGRSTGDGSGLGLAVARRLVELDGGTLTLRDGAAGGLEAVVRLRPPS